MWQGIHGHDQVVDRFRGMLAAGRLGSSFLLIGPEGVGKRALAQKLAQGLLCQATGKASLDACGHCESCRLADAGTHPDLHLVAKPPDRQFLPVELLIGDRDHRLREGLCHAIALKPFFGGRKIAILDDADTLHAEAANCLLKTLEEPPPEAILILIGTSLGRQLPTIRSRCQTIHFKPLTVDLVAQILLDGHWVTDAEQARRLAAVSGGAPGRAIQLRSDPLWQFRQALLRELAAPRLDPPALAKLSEAYVGEPGSDAAARRSRLRETVELAMEYFRQRMRVAVGAAATGDQELAGAVRQTVQRCGDPETAAALAERCIVALEQIDRNAHPRAVMDCWLDDLGRISTGHPAAF